MLTTLYRSITSLLLITLILSACGGSGSDDGSNNISPTANFSSVVASDTTPLTINLDATASSDNDGSIVSYSWTFGDGNQATGAIVSHTYQSTGSYNITLTVTDNKGATSTFSLSQVIASNVVAEISLTSPSSGAHPLVVSFDASNSSIFGSSNGTPSIVSYQWDFGDGTTGSGVMANHTYTSPGIFTAQLTVTDSSGDTDVDTTTIQTAFNLSGTISTASNATVDIDVNDPARQNRNNPSTNFLTNNSSIDAQRLPNPTILNGFISSIGSSPPLPTNSNFAFDSDNNDYYSAHLLEGQFISLNISDFNTNNTTENDIDLELYTTDLTLVAFSNSITAFESIAVATTGDYFIRVRSVSGVSKYVLNIGTTSLVTGIRAYGQSADLISGEAIVKLKSNHINTATVSSKALLSSALSLKITAQSHKQTTRPILMQFDTPRRQQSGVIAQQKNQITAAINQNNDEKLQTINLIKQLNNRIDVEYAEPNYPMYAKRTPNDNFYFLQAHYPQINLPQAWDITTGTPATGSVVVAVLDSGVVLNHEDLIGQFVAPSDHYDFVRDLTSSADGDGLDADPNDPGDGSGDNPNSWHGTHVAGTISAATNNNQGVAGVSWGAKIMPIRVLGRNGGTSYDVEQGIRFAAGLSNDSGIIPSKPADIINLSLGGSGFSQASQTLFNQINDAGIIVVASAGNESVSTPSYPASYENVISVSAVDLINNIAPYSNFGSLIDIAAPGGDLSSDRNADGYGDGVLSTFIDDAGTSQSANYQFYQGTSMASPHVAGVAALMKAVYPSLTPNDFTSSLQNGLLTDDLGESGRDNMYGFGLINALKSVQQAQLLAGGTATGSMLASPTRVNFGSVLTSRSLTLSQVGNTPPTVNSINKSASWLSIDNSTIPSSGAGTYTLTADRTGLNDATYTDNIIFSLNNGNNLTVPVTMEIQNTVNTNGDAGFLFVLLLDAETLSFVDQFDVDVNNGSYEFNFTNIPFGEYVIIAGSDIDNDLFICGLGETCGRYPTNDQPLRIIVDKNINGLDFLAAIYSDVIANAQTGSTKNKGVTRRPTDYSIPAKSIAK